MVKSDRFVGKVVLVSGASGALGKACAMRFAAEGAAVAVHYHAAKENAEETLRAIEQGGGRGMLVAADGRNQESAAQATAEVLSRLGRLDVLAATAGQHRIWRSLEQKQPDWEDAIHRNLSSTFYFAQAAADAMRKSGGGSIVTVSSKMATSTAPSNAAYCAAKAGVIAMTQVLAAEWARYKIRVNCVAPGVLNTSATREMIEKLDDGQLLRDALHARTPVGRLGEPEEIASVVAYLATGECDFLTGATVMVDGGWTSFNDYSGWGFARSIANKHS